MVLITPQQFRCAPCPSYPEIRLALWPWGRLGRMIEAHQPCAIHIATEGPLGWAARRYCLARGLPFTTAYHTRFPEYVGARFRVPLSWTYAVMRRFHAPASAVMVATQGIEDDLRRRGFAKIRRWSRGVDTQLFRPRDANAFPHLPRPLFLYVGRVAVEKNIEAFLRLDLPGSKVVVGDGPQRAELERRHPEVTFTGARFGEELAAAFASADAFVFPSRTDTFGLVLLEALACGVPVAAYPVPGPLDVIGDTPVGVLDEDLRAAALKALSIDRAACRAHAEKFSWEASARQFLGNLQPLPRAAWRPAATPPAVPPAPPGDCGTPRPGRGAARGPSG